jgi:hypothetical protein
METTKTIQELMVTLVRIRDNVSNKENKGHSKEKLLSDLEKLLSELIVQITPPPTVNKYSEDITSWDVGSGDYTGYFTKTINHNLNSNDIVVSFKLTATRELIGVQDFIELNDNSCLVVISSEEDITVTIL